MTRRQIFTAGIVVALFGGGFAVGMWISPRNLPTEESPTTGPPAESEETREATDLLADIDAIPTSEIGELYDKLALIPEPDIETVLGMKKIARRWIAERAGEFSDLHSKTELTFEWAWLDPNGLLIECSRPSNAQLLEKALFCTSHVAPESLLRFIEQYPELRKESKFAIPRAIYELTKTDPFLAAEFLRQFGISPGETANESFRFEETGTSRVVDLYGNVAQAMAKHDRAAAISWVWSLDSLEARGTALEHILADWIADSPGEAASHYRSLAGSASVDLRKIVDHVAEYDPVSAITWGVENASPSEKREVVASFTSELKDIQSIREVYEKLEEGNPRESFLQNTLLNWQQRDVPQGLDFVLSLTDDKRAQRIRELGYGVGRSQFDSGMMAAAMIGDSDLREQFEHSLIRSLATVDLERTLDLAKESGDENLLRETKDDGYRRFADSSIYSLREVASWLNDAQDNHTRNAITDALARRWFDVNPNEAVSWADSLEGDTRSRAFEQIARSMHLSDNEAAIEWVSALRDPQDFSAAVPAILSSLTDSSPEKAFRLASSLDGGERLRQLKHVVGTWAKRKPDEAWKAVSSASALSTMEKERLAVLIYGRR